MPKQQVTSEKTGRPSGHFSQTTMVETRRRLVFISGMLAKPDALIEINAIAVIA